MAGKAVILFLLFAISAAPLVTGQAPRLLTVPEDRGVLHGRDVVMTCVAISGGGSAPTIWWSQNGQPITTGGDFSITTSTITEGTVTFYHSNLQICSLDNSERGQYACNATNDGGFDVRFWTLNVITNVVNYQGSDPPGFALIPDNLHIPFGSTISMVCVAFDDDDRPAVSWWQNGDQINPDDYDDISVDERLHTHGGNLYIISILSICAIEDDDVGQFSCFASSRDGNATASWLVDAFNDSTPMPVVVPNQNGVPPIIQIVPGPGLVTYNNSVVMTCVASGSPLPTFTWSRFDIPAITSGDARFDIAEEMIMVDGRSYVQSTLLLCGVTAADFGQYSCFASNAAGNTTNTFMFSYAEILLAPDNLNVAYGSDVTMTCLATGVPRPAISWSIDGAVVDPSQSGPLTVESRAVSRGGQDFTVSLLRVCSLDESVTGEYACSVGGDTFYWSLDGLIRLNITSTGTSPRVLIGSGAGSTIAQVSLNSTAMLTCVAHGNPIPTITWRKDSMTLSNTTETDDGVIIYDSIVTESGTTFARSILQVCFVDGDETGLYTCEATNNLGSDSQDINLSYTEIVAVPSDIQADLGSTVTMSCIATGFPLPDITWRRDGSPLSTTANSISIANRVLTEGGQTFSISLLTVCSFGRDDIGQYSCMAANSVGATDMLSWQVTGNWVPPIIVIGPRDTYVELENQVVLECIAYGVPAPTVTWTRGGVPITNTTSPTVSVFPMDPYIPENTTFTVVESRLEICNFGLDDVNQYQCIAESAIGIHRSVFVADLDPFRTEVEVVAMTNDPTIRAETSTIISCVTYAKPGPATVTWWKDGVSIMNSTEVMFSERLITEGDLTFKYSSIQLCTVGMEDAGRYTCLADNGYRTESLDSILTVIPGDPPVIAISPNNSTFTVQERTITLVCAAYGFPLPDRIQWYRDGSLIFQSMHDDITQEIVEAGGGYFVRSTLQICDIGAADATDYACFVDNGYGNDTQPFSIDISFTEVVVSPPDNADYQEGMTYQFTCVAYGQPQPTTFDWSYTAPGMAAAALSNGSLSNRVTISPPTVVMQGGSPFLVTVLQLCDINVNDLGRFTCEASHNAHGDSQSFGLSVIQPGYGPFIVMKPTNYTLVNGTTTYSFACVAAGDQAPTISWAYGTQQLFNSSQYTIYQEQYTEGGFTFTQSVLQICNILYSDRGQYSCTARNQRISVEMVTFQIDVFGALARVTPESGKMDLLAGQSVSIEFQVPYSDPPPTGMMWYFTPEFGPNAGTEAQITSASNARYSFSSDQLSLSISGSTIQDHGRYRLAVQNLVGVNSGTISLSVYVEPQISTVGAPTTGNAGENVALTCVADGYPTPLIYWMKGGQIILPNEGDKYTVTDSITTPGQRPFIPETRTSVLTITSASAFDAGEFACIADNNKGRNARQIQSFQVQIQNNNDFCSGVIGPCMNGATCSSAAQSYVCMCVEGFSGLNCENSVPNFDIAPQITQGSQTTFVNHYAAVNLTCWASGYPKPTIQWYKDGEMLPSENLPYLYIASVDVWTRGAYNCTATNRAGVASQEVVVNLNDVIQYNLAVSIPATSSIFSGGDQNSVLMQFMSDLNAQVAGTLLDFNNGSSHAVLSAVSIPGPTPNYNPSNGALDVQVSYVIVDSTPGSDKTTIGMEALNSLTTLLVPAAQILGVTLTLPTTITRFDGCSVDTTGFNPSSTSTPATIMWPEIDVGATYNATCPCNDVGCATSAPRTATRVCSGDFATGGMWADASVSNCMYVVGTITSLDDGEVAVLTGDTVTVSFSLMGAYPTIRTQDIAWTFTNLDGDTTTITPSSKYVVSLDQQSLTITNAALTDAGTFTITANTVAGSVSSSVAVVVVVVPAIQGSAGVSITRDSGAQASFTCSADGIPTPSILWLKNGQLLQTGFSDRFSLEENVGATGQERGSIPESRTSVLTINMVNTKDSGSYQCQAINQYGNSATLSQANNLTVNAPPPVDYCAGITCQNQGFCTSGSSSFTCTCASGFNGANCENAVETESAPVFVERPRDSVVDFFQTVTLRCIVSGYPQPTIQWFKDSQLIDGENSQTFTIDSVDLPDRGLYSCSASNSLASIDSDTVVVNIRGVQQYLVTTYVPATSAPFTGVDLAQSAQLREAELVFLLQLNERVAGVSIDSDSATIRISSVQSQQITATSYSPATNQLQVTMLLTLFVSDYDFSMGGSPVTSDTLAQITQLLTDTANNVNTFGVMIPASEIQRFDGCSPQSDTFFLNGQSRGTLDWPETSIGWSGVAPCPCEQQSLQQLGGTRRCGGNFIQGGMWSPFDPLQTPCANFSELTWSICAATEVGGVFALTQDGSNIGGTEVALTAEIVENMVSDASGDRTATASLLSLIDNVLQAPQSSLLNSHVSFNTSGRLRAAVNQLADNIPVINNPEIIVLNTFGLVIYTDIDPTAFTGHTVATLLGMPFNFPTFTTDNVVVGGGGYGQTPTSEIRTPRTLFSGLSVANPTRVIYNVFLNDGLYARRQSYFVNTTANVSSVVVSARIAGDVPATDLADRVWMAFLKNTSAASNTRSQCSYWNQSLDGGFGAWSTEGCTVTDETSSRATCQCNQLASYALFANGTMSSDQTIGPYTVFGIAVLFVCAILVMLSFIVSANLRFTPLGITLINFCVAILLLCLSYVISEYLRARVDPNACYAFSAFFHYMILVNALAILMIAVFMVYVPYTSRAKKIGYFSAILINWMLPIVIVILSLAPNYQNYYNEEFCRPVSLSYWVGLLFPGCVIGVVIAVLLVIIPFRRRGDSVLQTGVANPQSTWKREYIGLLLVAILYYIGWAFGLPQTNTLGLGALRIIFQLIFVVCTGLTGLSLFLIFCFFSADIRHSWRNVFCFCFNTKDKQDKTFLINPPPVSKTAKKAAPFEADFTNPVAEDNMDDPLEDEKDPGLSDI